MARILLVFTAHYSVLILGTNMTNLSKKNRTRIIKHNLGLWQLYSASFETIWHRLNMMASEPINHPEFSRMVKEKEHAFSADITNAVVEMQKQVVSFWFSPYSLFNNNKVLGNYLKISQSLLKTTTKTAQANATRLRMESITPPNK